MYYMHKVVMLKGYLLAVLELLHGQNIFYREPPTRLRYYYTYYASIMLDASKYLYYAENYICWHNRPVSNWHKPKVK